MVDFLNTWSQRIIVVVVICTIIEMILPEGRNKNYIKTVAGIYVVFTIVGPIISKINIKENLNLEKYLKFPNSNVIETNVNIDNNKYIEEVYKEKLKTDLKAKINALGYTVESIDIKIETEKEETYGSILNLKLKITKKQEENKKNIIQIEPVKIGKEKNNGKQEISSEEAENIKSYIGEIYCIDKEKISVE